MNESEASDSQEKEKGFFRKLANGDFGLPKTYWIYGVLVGIVAGNILNLVEPLGPFLILMFAYTAYSVTVLIGIWRAANRYTGRKLWAVLAKIAVVINVILMALALLPILSVLL